MWHMQSPVSLHLIQRDDAARVIEPTTGIRDSNGGGTSMAPPPAATRLRLACSMRGMRSCIRYECAPAFVMDVA